MINQTKVVLVRDGRKVEKNISTEPGAHTYNQLRLSLFPPKSRYPSPIKGKAFEEEERVQKTTPPPPLQIHLTKENPMDTTLETSPSLSLFFGGKPHQKARAKVNNLLCKVRQIFHLRSKIWMMRQ